MLINPTRYELEGELAEMNISDAMDVQMGKWFYVIDFRSFGYSVHNADRMPGADRIVREDCLGEGLEAWEVFDMMKG